MQKFKIGDTVKCINNIGVSDYLVLDSIYEVIGYNLVAPDELYLADLKPYSWFEYRFEFVSSAPVVDNIPVVKPRRRLVI